MSIKQSLLILVLFYISILFSQETYNIEFEYDENNNKLSSCIELIENKPTEIFIGINIDYKNNIIFHINNAEWLFKILEKKKDGISVDIVSKIDFDCSTDYDYKTRQIPLGYLMPPVYLKDIKKKSNISSRGDLVFSLGQLPEEFINKDYEFNLLVIKDMFACHYQRFVNIARYKWDLLDMGLYTDTVTYKVKTQHNINDKRNIRTYNKRMKFVIPFEKNKTTYSSDDIKPLYDTLEFSNYIIKKISIRAYSSVEGEKEYNLALQKERGKSIVNALQTYQTELITDDISTSENWMEFFQSIKDTEFEYLSELTKQEIKEKLKNKSFAIRLEPVLQKQRKAVVEIDFVKRYKIENLTADELRTEFNKAINSLEVKKALDIQKIAFARIINNKMPSSFMSKLEIPEKKAYAELLNSNTVYNYFLDEEDLVKTYNDIKNLKKMVPQSMELWYNYLALKFYIWTNNIEPVDHKQFKKEILGLKQKGIPITLVNRMMVNYNIILTEIYMNNKEYDKKNKTLKRIYYKYKYTQPSASDLLSISQYFVSYAKYDWATKLLKPHITKVDVDEDLLFYYINLTVLNNKTLREPEYKQILLNAVDINTKRFCKMFNPNNRGGVSFQLLRYDILNSTYCQSCED